MKIGEGTYIMHTPVSSVHQKQSFPPCPPLTFRFSPFNHCRLCIGNRALPDY